MRAVGVEPEVAAGQRPGALLAIASGMAPAPPSEKAWERRHGAACGPLRTYRRRKPEHTLLHAVVRERLEPFLASARERSAHGRGLPAHVERDLRAYLDCGILARGFARVRCNDCGFERLVAFSCKAHSCPSCNARRMEDASARLVERVFPPVPVRQWVLSFPRRLRFLAAREPRVASRLLEHFTRALFAWQRRAARRAGVSAPRTAGVTAVQRFGGAINLNVHFHTLVTDGVFDLAGPGPARFVPLPAPGAADVERVLAAVIRKVVRSGLAGEESPGGDDALSALQAREVERRLSLPDPLPPARRAAYLDGYSLHAGVRIHGNDREGLARLCRYALRPPLALQRLEAGPEGRLVYRMKRPRGGSLLLVLTPDELLAKLAALVPPPRSHALRYHGLFAPNSRHRARVVPGPELPLALADATAGSPSGGDLAGAAPAAPPLAHARPPAPVDALRPQRIPWAELLRRVFAIDVLDCPRCHGRLELIAFIAEPGLARRILDHLRLASQAPPLAPARAADPAEGDAHPDDGTDPVYED